MYWTRNTPEFLCARCSLYNSSVFTTPPWGRSSVLWYCLLDPPSAAESLKGGDLVIFLWTSKKWSIESSYLLVSQHTFPEMMIQRNFHALETKYDHLVHWSCTKRKQLQNAVIQWTMSLSKQWFTKGRSSQGNNIYLCAFSISSKCLWHKRANK